MRVVKDIPHDKFKITVFSYNDKYLLKFEIGTFEQTFKVKHQDIEGLSALEKLIDEEFLKTVMNSFLAMRTGYHDTYKRNINE